MKKSLFRMLLIVFCVIILSGCLPNDSGGADDSSIDVEPIEETNEDTSSTSALDTENDSEPYWYHRAPTKEDIAEFVDPEHGHYVFEINDMRENKTDLIGRYVSDENPELFFEIKEDEAILHYSFGLWHGFLSESEYQVLEIMDTPEGVVAYFCYKIKGSNAVNVANFYLVSETEGIFRWSHEAPATYLYKE